LEVKEVAIESILLVAADEERDRELPLRVYLPTSGEALAQAPVVMFSHGLGGSRDNNAYLGEHWARRGYVAVFIQHPGSDEDLWRSQRGIQARVQAMESGATLKQMLARFADVPGVIDALELWHETEGHALHGRLQLDAIGISGHSFGAITAQGVAGQGAPRIGRQWHEPRVKAAVVMSPSPPSWGRPEAAFAGVDVPWLLLTGTEDDSPLGRRTTPEDRLQVFPHLKTAPAWQLVFDQGDHMVYSDASLRGPLSPAQRQQRAERHRAILAATTAFWDAFLRQDEAALKWLQGEALRDLLEEEDEWSFNGVEMKLGTRN
jgi:predicted dienelactone hydrolase